MITTGKVVALIQAMGGGADPAVIESAVQDWLDAHPEATTTVQDGSITEQKLATSIAQKLGLISSLSDEIVEINNTINNPFYSPVLSEKDSYFVGPNGYAGSLGFVSFEPVLIENGVKYVEITCSFYGNSGIVFFTDSGAVLLSINGNNASEYGLTNKSGKQTYKATIPQNAYSFAASMWKTDNYSELSDFAVKFYLESNEIIVSGIMDHYFKLTDPLVSKWFPGKKIVTQGDSLTANGHSASNEINTGYWQSIMHDILGATIVNIGVGGTTVTNDGRSTTQNGYNITDSWMCSDERVAMIPSDADMVLFWGGHNDWGKSVPIGTVGQETPDDQTFVGALQIALTKMIARVPNAVIVFVTPHVSRPATNANSNVLAKNSLNLTMVDYAKAVEDFCKYYGFPCISMSDSGISVLNHAKYCADIIHVNNGVGAKAVASAIINGLVRHMPVVS